LPTPPPGRLRSRTESRLQTPARFGDEQEQDAVERRELTVVLDRNNLTGCRDVSQKEGECHQTLATLAREELPDPDDRRGMKESAVMLSAVEAVAHADAVPPSRRDDADAAAQAAAGVALGVLPRSSGFATEVERLHAGLEPLRR
jgi:hypothetical protein